MDCKEVLEKLYLYLDHEILTERERQQIEEHLKWCFKCCQMYELEKNLESLIRINGRNDEVPPSLFFRIENVIARF